MGRRQIVCLGLVALLLGLMSTTVATAGQVTFAVSEPDDGCAASPSPTAAP